MKKYQQTSKEQELSVPAFGDDYTKYNQNYQKTKTDSWYDVYFFEL
tara:strand:- start:2922 stop:3059 length:138 start_codon:yes stop_codon:yes gene_type:complete